MPYANKRVITRRCRAEFKQYEHWIRLSKQTPVKEHRRRFITRALDHLNAYFDLEDELVRPS
jgi:hypothetical protein